MKKVSAKNGKKQMRAGKAARRQIDTREDTTEMLADFAAHGEKRDILKFGMAFYKKNLVVCKELPKWHEF